MEQVLKVALLGIVGAILALTVKKSLPEFAILVGIAASAAILLLFLAIFSPVKDLIGELAETAGLSPAVLSPLFKVLGIAIVTKFASDVCLDAGEKTISTTVEMAGAAGALYVALPLISTFFSLLRSFT